MNPRIQTIHSRRCRAGEEQTPSGTCQRCGYGFFLLHAPDRAKQCKPCDQNAICYGANLLAPRPGFFRSGPLSEQILECFNKKACLGGDLDTPTGECSDGYTGLMCGACEAGYYKQTWLTCASCGSWDSSIASALFRLLWFTVLILGIAHLNVTIADTGSR